MNLADYLIIFILILFALKGISKGFIRGLFGLFKVFIVIVLNFIIKPVIESLIKASDFYISLRNNIAESIRIPDLTEGMGFAEYVKYIEGLEISDFFKQYIINIENQSLFEKIGVNAFNEYISDYALSVIVGIIAFIIAVVLSYIFVNIISLAFHLVEKLPVIRCFNKMGGALMYMIVGVFVIWIVILVIKGFYIYEGSDIISIIENSLIAKEFYERDFLLKLFLDL